MQAQHWNGAVLCQLPGLAGMEIEKTVFLWKDHDEIGFVMAEVFEDAFFHLGFTDIMDLRVKVFELVLPAAGFEADGLIGEYLPGFHGDDVEAGPEMFAQVLEEWQGVWYSRADVVQITGQQDVAELLEGGGFGYD